MDVKELNPSPWISSLTIYSIITFVTTLTGLVYLKRLRFVDKCHKIAGPTNKMPFLFALRLLFFSPEEFMTLVLAFQLIWGRITSGMICAWVGPIPFFFATTAEAAEVVLASNKHIKKSSEYNFLHPWLNTGLLTSTGNKWQSRRKLLTPAFHFKILEDFVTVFNEQSRILVDKLNHVASNKDNDFDIFPYITRCTLDIICDSAMGKNVEAQSKSDSDYVKSVYKMSSIAQLRQVKFYLQPDWMFKWTSYWPDQRKSLEILHGFTDQVIRERKLYHQQNKKQSANNSENLHDSTQTDDLIPKRRRLAFLDLLIEASQDGKVLSDMDIREEVDTFMFEGHDTTSAAIAWSIFLIGSYPRVQELVNEEINSIFGDSDRPIAMNDLSELKYLECCIKEALRLYPSVPIYGRELAEDTVIGGDEIPSGQSVFVCPYYLHRDPRYFPNPEVYQPERFLAENSIKRHPYAYVPFSAGPRNCIGQRFALMEEKCVLASIFRNFHVKSLDKRDEIVLMAELILRPRDGIRVQLVPKH